MNPARSALSLVLALFMTTAPVLAQGPAPTREALVKSAMVYNFIRFIEWPNGSSEDREVCSYSGSRFATALDSISGKPVGDGSVRTRVLDVSDNVDGCDVIVLSQADETLFYTQDVSLNAESILTVGDSPDFARRGGVIGFTDRDGRVGFEVNVEQADLRALNFSSRLLRLANIVSGQGGSQ